MLDFLFTIIIYPIQLMLECIYVMLSVSIFKENIALSLSILSLFVNLLCLPLYTKAEQLQQNERAIQQKMAKRIASIKKHFKGDEQYMILSMYYRENKYHPVMALRSSLSLLLQIPFFMAAYSFLSHLESLHNKSLFFIKDLSSPDALFSLGNFSINMLPVIMTIINIIAGSIYSKGFPLKEKIQLYVMSLIFLALLYHSPSALVLYWTMNNIFSLVKNIMFKIKNPRKFVYIAGCLLCAAFMLYVCFFRYNAPARAFRNRTFSVALFLFFSGMPLYIKAVNYAAKKWFPFIFEESRHTNLIFLLSCIAVWVLIGCYIPINLVASDPEYFASIPNVSVFQILYYPAAQAMGLFLFWAVYIFFLTSRTIRPLLSALSAVFAFCVFVNFYIFTGNYGIISDMLTFSLKDGFYLHDTLLKQILNVAACAVAAILVFSVIFFKKEKWLPPLLVICIFSSGFLSITKAVEIKTIIAQSIEPQEQFLQNIPADNTELVPAITLSKTGKNVLLIMLDGAVNSYFPLFLRENPDFSGSFDGFTYYPNTVTSYGRTLFGAPPLFGGYEYTSYNMHKRNDEKMKDKHNEALFLLPTIFKEHNFDVSVSNLPYVNYGQALEADFYAAKGIRTEKIIGRYSDKYIHEALRMDGYSDPVQFDKLLRRNIFMLAMLETSIFTLRDIIYQNGKYWGATDYAANSGVPKSVIDNYTALYYLPGITALTSDERGSFAIMGNDLTHDAVYLQYPHYTVEERITAHGDNFFGNDSFKYYHVNSAAYILLTKWFDYLRLEGVWDNTRIIIVSDHGDGGLTHPDFSNFQNNHVLPYNPILLFKDFGNNEALQTNNDFMTNADVPFLALKDIAENPTNPFTGKPLTPDKNDGIYIFTGGRTNTSFYAGTTCLEDNSKFFHVQDSIFDSRNWNELKYKDFKNRKINIGEY
jgi:YidC/Oxa1 family membrane protein insertase